MAQPYSLELGTDEEVINPTVYDAYGASVAAPGEGPGGSSRCNVGGAEQKLRIGVGAALLAAAAFAPVGRGWRLALAAFGAAEVITGTMSYCPVWDSLGIDTRSPSERRLS